MARNPILESLDAVPKSGAGAATAYNSAKAVLTARVDRELADDPAKRGLIGDNPLRMMFANHRNHAQFIATVLQIGCYELMPKTIPWVYRAYLNQGFSTEYFQVELRAWQDAIQAELAAEHAAEVLPIYRWMAEHHDAWITLAQLRADTALSGSEAWKLPREGYFAALLNGNVQDAQQIAQAAVPGPDDVITFFEEVIHPAMYEIGLRWEAGEISPAREHRATAITIRLLAGLQFKLGVPASRHGRALVAAAPNEHHELGAQMLAMLLELDGWSVSYLGADTPAEDLIGMAGDEQPHMIAISVAMPYNVDRTADLIQQLRANPDTAGTKLMIGGHAFVDVPEVGLALDADALPMSLREAVCVARQWSLP
jgi:MerR family transcriptional regulator, light-induced transcriptional regulator